MQQRTPIWAYGLAVFGGVAAMWVLVDVAATTPLFLAFAVLGGMFGIVWPRTSWRWAIWMSGPMVLTVIAGIALYGVRPVDVFIVVGVPLFTGAGGYGGAMLRGQRDPTGPEHSGA